MLTCEHCNSHNVRSFTPARYSRHAAVLLCMMCRRLTILPPHAGRRPARRATRTEQAA